MVDSVTCFKTSDGKLFEVSKEAQSHELMLLLDKLFTESGILFDDALQASQAIASNVDRIKACLQSFDQPITRPAPKLVGPSTVTLTTNQTASDEELLGTDGSVPVAPQFVEGQNRKWGQVPRSPIGQSVSVGDGAYMDADGTLRRPIKT